MGSRQKTTPPKAYTPPKGAPTPSRHEHDDAQARANRRVRVQWAVVIVLFFVILGAIFYFGSDTGGSLQVPTGGHTN